MRREVFEFLVCMIVAIFALAVLMLLSAPAWSAPVGREQIVINRREHQAWNDRENGLVFAPATFPVCRGIQRNHHVRVGVEGASQGRSGLWFIGYEIEIR